MLDGISLEEIKVIFGILVVIFIVGYVLLHMPSSLS